MKKIYGIIAVVAALLLSACTGDLDQKPVIGDTSETVYNSVEGYRSVLAKIYSTYSLIGAERGGGSADISSEQGQDMLRTLFNLQELPTDEAAYKYLSGDNLSNITYMSWDATDVWVSDAYYRLFYIISLTNELLRNCTDSAIAKFSEADAAVIRTYALEARFMRAFTYWWVLDLFGKAPYVDQDTPMTGFIPEVYNGSQLYDFIKGEIDAIAPQLPVSPSYARAGQGAAYALGARLAINGEVYTGQNHATEAIEYCRKVMALGYTLENDYKLLFNADNDRRTNEIIFAFATDNANSATWGSATYLIAGSCPNDGDDVTGLFGVGTAWGNFSARGEFTSLFDRADTRFRFLTDGRDEFFTDGIETAGQGYRSLKWTNLTDEGEQACVTDIGVNTDFPIFRLAEIYLTAAEAVVRGGSGMDRTEARNLVNELRRRAFGNTDADISDAQLNLEFILDERARELYYELHRRTDLVRFGKFTTAAYLWQWKGGVIDGRAVDARYNIYPIPATELSANPNLKNELY